ncbi:MAG: malectin domain-containing carbohydrate-binding protein [Planctomycetota bacterium]
MNACHVPLLTTLTLAAASLTAPVAAAPQRVGCVWERLADSPIGRFEAGTIPIDGQLYCFGGFFTQSIRATERVDAYDPGTDTWTRKADMPTPTTHVGFVLEGRNVWMIAGFVGDNPGFATDEVWVYDIDLDQWSAGPSMPRPIASGGAALFGRELHYFGGCEADRDTMTGDHWVLDLDAQGLGWQPRAPMPEPRCHHSGATLGGEVWAIGGQFGHDSNPLDTRFVHAYDPATDTWRDGPLLPEPRSHFEPATFVRNGNLYIAGGKDLTSNRDGLAGMLELDPVLEEWTYTIPLPNARYGAGVQPIGSLLYAANGAALFNDPRPDLYSRDFDASFPDPLLINCGGPEVVAASGTCCWCGDIGYVNGNERAYDSGDEILGTDDDDVFHRQRRGFFPTFDRLDYRIALGEGFYRVGLLFAERQFGFPGGRVMDVTIEGDRVVEDLDLFAETGVRVALERTFDVEAADGVLDIQLGTPSGQQPLIAALRIERLGPAHFEFECTSAPNSTGSPATIDFVGTTSVAIDDLEFFSGPVPNNTFGLYIQAELPGSTSLPGGTLCVQQPFFRLPIEQAVQSVLSHRLSIANPPTQAQRILAGSTWRFQAWYRDAVTSARYGLTDAVKLVFTP